MFDFIETSVAMNDTMPTCTECGRPISHGDGVWYRPFAEDHPQRRLADDLRDRLSESDNGGAPFHRACFRRIAPELSSNDS
jgi:hypothetical protein